MMLFQLTSRPEVDRLVMEGDNIYLKGMEGFNVTSQNEHLHINVGRSLHIKSKVDNF